MIEFLLTKVLCIKIVTSPSSLSGTSKRRLGNLSVHFPRNVTTDPAGTVSTLVELRYLPHSYLLGPLRVHLEDYKSLSNLLSSECDRHEVTYINVVTVQT